MTAISERSQTDWSPESEESIAEAGKAWAERHRDELGSGRKAEFTSSSGKTIEAVYTPANLPDFSYQRELGFPGDAPYTRGATPAGYRKELRNSEFYAGFGSAREANRRYRYLMAQGSTGGVSIALDLPTQIGMDSDHPLAQRDIGVVGVAINGLQDVLDIFDGMELKKVGKIFTTGNAIGPIALAWFYALAEAKGEDPRDVVVTVQNDPLKEYVARGTQFLPVETSVELACDAVEFCIKHQLPWYPISVSGSHMKQAGGTCAQEAAFTLANALGYADVLYRRGIPAEVFAPHFELHFCTDMDFFEEIAKYRVVRRVWSELLKARYGAENVPARLHAATSRLPTAQQPMSNISRITLQALAQVLGGVEQTRTASFDEGLAIPSENAVKISIRINQIIGHETGVADTVDPVGGSYYLEATTRAMYDEVWGILAKVEEMGGAVEAVKSGYFANELGDGAYRQQRELEEHERVIVGVNEFVDDEAAPIKVFKLDPEAAQRQRDRVREFKQQRDQAAVAAALDRLRRDAEARVNSVPSVLAAVKVGATVGEISDVWRAAFGEYRQEAGYLG